MQLIDDSIDFAEYAKGPPEAAHVRSASEYVDDVLERFRGTTLAGRTLPWSKTHHNIRFRPGEVSVWSGTNGHGKSQMLGHVCIGLMEQGAKVCIASMEMKPAVTMTRFCRQVAGTNRPTEALIRTTHSWTDGKLWLYGQQGTVKSDRILAVARYCHDKLRVEHFVIDSLMKCGINSDDYNRQKSFIDELCAHAKDTGQHIHLVAHSRKGESERHIPGKFDIKGASEITDQVDNVFTVWRNKEKEEAIRTNANYNESDPDAILNCTKQRNGEWEGGVLLFFHAPSMQYTAVAGQPIPHYQSLEPRAVPADSGDTGSDADHFRSWA